ncbi:uncharacterized protein isoform X2 [Choristoneura fumiferana]|uniref:uncharacterized protein isoform X2 n=1 Tax=Choristoneura fumiferana TaxID=7141 RepID=UPI003D15E6E9
MAICSTTIDPAQHEELRAAAVPRAAPRAVRAGCARAAAPPRGLRPGDTPPYCPVSVGGEAGSGGERGERGGRGGRAAAHALPDRARAAARRRRRAHRAPPTQTNRQRRQSETADAQALLLTCANGCPRRRQPAIPRT